MSDKQVKEEITKLEDNFLHPEIIQDNKIHFHCNDLIYRVRMPVQKELMEADSLKNQHQVKLLQLDDTLSLKQLKKILVEKKGIDIDALEQELKDSEEDMVNVYKKLVKRSDEDKDGIEKDKEALGKIKKMREDISLEIAEHTAISIESQSESYYMSFLSSVCTEQMVFESEPAEWNPVWKSFDDFLNTENTNVKHFGLGYLTHLLMSVR